MKGEGPIAEMIDQMFDLACKKEGLTHRPTLSTAAFRRPNETRCGCLNNTRRLRLAFVRPVGGSIPER